MTIQEEGDGSRENRYNEFPRPKYFFLKHQHLFTIRDRGRNYNRMSDRMRLNGHPNDLADISENYRQNLARRGG